MGKRELVLIAVFLVVGIVVYQVTAPPAAPGSDVSVGGILSRIRRGMRGARETASAESRQTYPVLPSATQLRVNLPRASDLTITGSDRDDISVEIRATARGYTTGEAKTAAEAAQLKVEPGGDAMVISGMWDSERRSAGDPFILQATVTLLIPRRLEVNLQPHIGLLNVSGVARVESVSSRGETHVVDTAGPVQLTHIGGTLEVRGATALKLSARNSRGDVSDVTGAMAVEAIGSRLKLAGLGGTLEIDSRNTDVTLEKIAGLKPPLRYSGIGGELRIDGLQTEARIDGRNTDITVKLDAPAPVTIYNLGSISVTAPPGGYTLDAAATDGRISSDDSSITATPGGGPDARAAAKIRGGGPTLTLRATRGNIDVRAASGAAVK